jgi:hypothetical protein
VDVALHLRLREFNGKTNERRTALRIRRELRYWASRRDTRRRADTEWAEHGRAAAANLIMVMEVMCSVRPREGEGNARTDGATERVRQVSGQRAKDSGLGDEMVADECKAS